MTPNRSLALSVRFRKMLRQDLLSVLSVEFPFELIENYKREKKTRDRVYNPENTLLTMILSATQEDKSLQHAVNLFSEIHQRSSERMKKLHQEQPIRGRGRPKKGTLGGRRQRVAKSKIKPISEDTSAFSQARIRLDPALVDAVFKASGAFECTAVEKWRGLEVFMTDGTYIETQDTRALRAVYDVRDKKGKSVTPYPQALLQAIVKQSTGAVTDFQLGTRHVSELALAWPMVGRLPAHSVLLADDLYNTYAFFSIVQSGSRHIIVPGKRKRAYTLIDEIAPGDKIIEIKRTKRPKWLPDDVSLPPKLTLRKIDTLQGPLYTTLTDRTIPAAEIVELYRMRWDIEITIREVKTLMNIDVVRSKTPEMVLKEIQVALTAYNLIRRVMAKTTLTSGFPPETDLIQAFYEIDSTLLRDKRGRVYARWSPGRYGAPDRKNQPPHNSPSSRPTLRTQDQTS